MIALKQIDLKDVVFIDIETARVVKELQLDTPLFDSWEYTKRRDCPTNEELIESFKQEAGLYAEFGKIVCISIGRIKGDKLKITTYNDSDESVLLQKFNDGLSKVTEARPKTRFCGHAAIGFDIPYIFKRCLVNGVVPNPLLDMAHLKPWETTVVDTKDLWKGTSFRPSSLINIAVALGIPSPKDDINGAEVGDLYWSDEPNRIQRISTYCEKDVLTTANIVRKCRFEPLLERDNTGGEVEVVALDFLTNIFNGGSYTKAKQKKIIDFMSDLSQEQRGICYVLLNGVVSTAKGKKTKLTKANITQIKNHFDD